MVNIFLKIKSRSFILHDIENSTFISVAREMFSIVIIISDDVTKKKYNIVMRCINDESMYIYIYIIRFDRVIIFYYKNI